MKYFLALITLLSVNFAQALTRSVDKVATPIQLVPGRDAISHQSLTSYRPYPMDPDDTRTVHFARVKIHPGNLQDLGVEIDTLESERVTDPVLIEDLVVRLKKNALSHFSHLYVEGTVTRTNRSNYCQNVEVTEIEVEVLEDLGTQPPIKLKGVSTKRGPWKCGF
ncbi:hypothetical protein [Bdellovibrio sp. HCB337]|uniref:hypothetical protein n=1 Tax=Bdellovibrio sp. HCB337 TaxID=3394358 RepID=UPI0039A5C252